MYSASTIHPDKIQAYMATDYRLGYPTISTVLTIGERSDALASLFAQKGVHCGAFITAWNPYGEAQANADNDAAHDELGTALRSMQLEYMEGSGKGRDGLWPAERSYFVFGLPLDAAKLLSQRFTQDAIVWVGEDCVPQLVLLR